MIHDDGHCALCRQYGVVPRQRDKWSSSHVVEIKFTTVSFDVDFDADSDVDFDVAVRLKLWRHKHTLLVAS